MWNCASCELDRSGASSKPRAGQYRAVDCNLPSHTVPILTSDEYRLGKAKRTTLEAKSSQRLGSATDPETTNSSKNGLRVATKVVFNLAK